MGYLAHRFLGVQGPNGQILWAGLCMVTHGGTWWQGHVWRACIARQAVWGTGSHCTVPGDCSPPATWGPFSAPPSCISLEDLDPRGLLENSWAHPTSRRLDDGKQEQRLKCFEQFLSATHCAEHFRGMISFYFLKNCQITVVHIYRLQRDVLTYVTLERLNQINLITSPN